ncbi:DUF6622 family protein [Aquabacterium sp.]|uniref:DUF6622 family protein n=1 Tax=Aquabacterium sp. TaxID=1872578 RepID=UPI003783739A
MGYALEQIVSHTPLWVWGLLAGLIALGLRQARDHVLRRGALLVLPLVLATMSLAGASNAFGLLPGVVLAWLTGLAAGAVAFTLLKLPLRAQTLPDGRFAVGGSWLPMVLLIGVFLLRYAVSASLAMHPALAHATGFALGASLLYGGVAGLFARRAWRILAQAPRAAVVLTA